MAKHRKRFYVAYINGGGLEILSLKMNPSREIYLYSHSKIEGPFQTFNKASEYLMSEAR